MNCMYLQSQSQTLSLAEAKQLLIIVEEVEASKVVRVDHLADLLGLLLLLADGVFRNTRRRVGQ